MTAVRILSRTDVERALDLDELVGAVADALRLLSAGRVSAPPRIGMDVPEVDGSVLVMAAHASEGRTATTKIVSVFPRNRELPTHQALLVVFDASTGAPAAVMDGDHVTAARTAAGSRLATRLLAVEEASVLAVIGAGVQARAHLRALLRERPFEEVRIAARHREHADRLAALASELTGARVIVAAGPEEAMGGAHVVCATTSSADPVVRRAWLSPGTHVNSVGWTPDGREVDEETVRDALVVVESREAALSPPPAGSNDLRWGPSDRDGVAVELGELVAGDRPGREDAQQLTLYKSVGVAIEDDAAAALVLSVAERAGIGTLVEL
jgi:ornithine cyclodeaminase